MGGHGRPCRPYAAALALLYKEKGLVTIECFLVYAESAGLIFEYDIFITLHFFIVHTADSVQPGKCSVVSRHFITPKNISLVSFTASSM